MTTARASLLLRPGLATAGLAAFLVGLPATLIAAGAAGLFSAGCHGASPTSPTAAADGGSEATAVVHVEDDGRTLDVLRGGTVRFELARHAGTGFEWVPAPADGGALVQHGPRRSVRTSDIAGAPKLDVYEFVAQTAGTTTIEMQLARPWQDGNPVKTVRVTVNVR